MRAILRAMVITALCFLFASTAYSAPKDEDTAPKSKKVKATKSIKSNKTTATSKSTKSKTATKKKSVRKKRKPKAVETPFMKLRREYLVYKGTTKERKEDALNAFMVRFKQYYDSPKKTEADGATYFTADIYEKLYEVTKKVDNIDKAKEIYRNLSKTSSSEGMASQKKLQLFEKYGLKAVAMIVADENSSPSATLPADDSGDANEDDDDDNDNDDTDEDEEEPPSEIIAIKHTGGEKYSRITIEMSGISEFTHRFLRADSGKFKPDRIVIDVHDAEIPKEKQRPLIIRDSFVEQIRVGTFAQGITRAVIDLKGPHQYRTFMQDSPPAIVVDVADKLSDCPVPTNALVPPLSVPVKPRLQEATLKDASKVKYTVRKIVIDAGHGGHDPGAVGHAKLQEKDVVLDIALKVGLQIKEQFPSMEIIYTRSTDVFLPLEMRTDIANQHKADLFVSIHANASKNKSAHGIETYFLSFAKEKRAVEVAARENAIQEQAVGEVQNILRDLIASCKYNESSLLASMVQNGLVTRAKKERTETNDLGVKQGPFYVLIGANMPSILVETAFLTNADEGRMLSQPDRRRTLASGITDGIKEYIYKTATSIW